MGEQETPWTGRQSITGLKTTNLIKTLQDNRRNEPIAGRGRYRKQGQKIGEMELSVLLSRNAKKFIETSRRGQDREFNQRFLDNLLGLGMMEIGRAHV